MPINGPEYKLHMLIYIIFFIITCLLALTNNERKNKISPFFFFGYCLCLGMFVGMSDMLGGYDRYIYAEAFQTNAEEMYHGNGVFNDTFIRLFGKEPIYGLINSAIGYFTPNRYIYIFVYTMVMYSVLPVAMYRYSKNPFFALMIFMGLLFFFSFTYLRQVMACGVVWLSFNHVVNKNFRKFAVFVAIATMIHNSAVYFLLLYFIPIRKFPRDKIIMVMVLLFILGLTGITGSLFAVSGALVSNDKISSYSQTAEYGFRIEYVIESVLFLFILLINYSKIKTDRYSLVVHNIYLMFCGVLLFFCKSSDGGRIAWYCTIGIMIILTELCTIKTSLSLRTFTTMMMATLFMRILLAWGILLYPYKTFFTPGYRQNDFIYDIYEYDYYYDSDKFYNINHHD